MGNLIVTGSSGLIGSEIVEHFAGPARRLLREVAVAVLVVGHFILRPPRAAGSGRVRAGTAGANSDFRRS